MKLFRTPAGVALVGGVALLTGLVAASATPAQSAIAGRSSHPTEASSIKKATSTQWSGYVDTDHKKDGTFRNVAASWNVPEIPDSACPSGSYGYRLAVVWAGLGGWGGSTVPTAGTESICRDGILSYEALIQFRPSLPADLFPVSAGDHMSAYVDYTGSHWLLTVVDDSQDEEASTLLACPSGRKCNDNSAEVVAGAPSGCEASATQQCNGSLFPLADFGYVMFSGVSDATSKAGGSLGTSSFGPEEVTAKKGTTVLAEVTKAFKNDGFQDSWESAER